jgi:radical SAM superfamily enzyme YgiQ (UPF0313 family)
MLEESGHEVHDICYAETAEAIRASIDGVDVVVVGDFRYYAYFCNPAPLIERVISVLQESGFRGRVLIAGRHARYLDTLCERLQANGTPSLSICPSMSDLGNALRLAPSLAERLGSELLPRPGRVSMRFAQSPALPGSRSRPQSRKVAQLFTASGCRFNCAFCEKARTPVVPFQISQLEEQIRTHAAEGVNYLILWDEVFGQKGTQYQNLLQLTKRFGIGFGCNTRQDHINEEFADELAEGGCEAILFGVELSMREHGKPTALRLDRGKEPTEERFRSVVKVLKQRSIKAVASIIVGLPDDDESSISRRIAAVKDIGFSQVYARPLVPFPESSFYHTSVSTGQIPHFGQWSYEQLDTYPLGYPTVSSIPREQLIRLSDQ